MFSINKRSRITQREIYVLVEPSASSEGDPPSSAPLSTSDPNLIRDPLPSELTAETKAGSMELGKVGKKMTSLVLGWRLMKSLEHGTLAIELQGGLG